MLVVSDSGPVIHLSSLGLLDLLPTLFGRQAAAFTVPSEHRDGADRER